MGRYAVHLGNEDRFLAEIKLPHALAEGLKLGFLFFFHEVNSPAFTGKVATASSYEDDGDGVPPPWGKVVLPGQMKKEIIGNVCFSRDNVPVFGNRAFLHFSRQIHFRRTGHHQPLL
jgi:hypothetical protein